jgi:hypothetical protein
MNDGRPQLLQLNSQSSADRYILTHFGVFVKKRRIGASATIDAQSSQGQRFQATPVHISNSPSRSRIGAVSPPFSSLISLAI